MPWNIRRILQPVDITWEIFTAILAILTSAIEQYKAAIKIDDLFYPAKINLAMIYNQQGDNENAELLFRDVISTNPELPDIYYSFGLLLAEQQKYTEAAEILQKAIETYARTYSHLL